MLEKLNIVRDCYWLMPSGDRYLHDENGALSSHTNGLYTSLNADDNDYIVASDSGNIRYYGRLESTNVNTTGIYATLRASCVPDGSAVLSINNYEMLSIPVSGGINDYETTVILNDAQYQRIHYGRIDNNYDYFDIVLDNGEDAVRLKTPDIWLMADSGVSTSLSGGGTMSDGDYVTTWTSQDNDNIVFKNSYGNQYKPRYTESVINGKPALRFWNPSGMFLATNDYATQAECPLVSWSGVMYTICQPEDSPNTDSHIFTLEGDDAVGYWRFGMKLNADHPYLTYRVGTTSPRYAEGIWTLPSGTPTTLGLRSQERNFYATVDCSGVTTTQSHIPGGNWFGSIVQYMVEDTSNAYYCVGNSWDGSNPLNADYGFDGYIAEIMIYESPLSSGDLMGLEQYIENKYGVVGVSYQSTQLALHNLEVYYSGGATWDNHQTGLPNVNTDTYWAKSITTPIGMRWDGTVDAISSGVSIDGVDDAYIEFNGSNQYTRPDFYKNPNFRKYPAQLMPSGYLDVQFDYQDLKPLTKITRARMNLRMSLPLASGDNKRDTFEVNGYNPYYKNQDHREDLEYVNASQPPRDSRFGYYTYGAGTIVEQSGFQTYNVELNFLDPLLPSGNYQSTRQANSDMLANMEFQFVGLPSGTRMSGVELQVEYVHDNFTPLYTVGSTKLSRCPSSGVIDAGTSDSFSTGHGGWHHQGWRLRGPTVIEEDVFTNFYTFSEGPANTRTYPETTKAYYFPTGNEDSTVYADYLLAPPYDESDITPLLKDPQRREYYRNPISATDLTPVFEDTPRDISSYKPHYYRHMIYHGASLDYVDVELEDGDATRLATDDLCQIYFNDRVGLGESFTLYFVIYRDYGFQSYGRFFHRGLLEYQGIGNYEIYGDLEPNLVRFTVQGANGTDNKVEVEVNQYTKEPILIWFTCGYEQEFEGMTTMTLNVHQDTKNYFSQDWIRTQRHFTGRRKEYASNNETHTRPDGTEYTVTWGGPRTCLGTLEQLTVYEQMSRRLYLHHASPVEFGYKGGEAIDLDYTTSTAATQIGYDTSDEKDKFFLRTRVANSQYLQHNPSGVRWVVPDGSGEARWRTRYNVFESLDPDNIHSIYNPVSTAGTNHIVHPSAVYVELDLVHSTNHPSGLTMHMDVEFDSGTSDNWKVAHTTLAGVPSGGALWLQYAPIKYNTATNKHINMDDAPIRWSDLENINITMTTEYPGDGENSYHGSVEVRSMRVFFDSYCIAATGINDLDLYTEGGATTLVEPQLDLYTIGKETISTVPDDGSLDLYIYGVALQASGDMTLYTYGIPSPIVSPDDDGVLPLYIGGIPYNSGIADFNRQITLYTKAPQGGEGSGAYLPEPAWMLPLFLDAGEAPIVNVSGENKTCNLYLDAGSTAITNTTDLYLFNYGLSNTMSNYICGHQIPTGSGVDFYIKGSGGPITENLELFTSGF